MIKIKTKLTVGKAPQFGKKAYGKLQASSQDLAGLAELNEKCPVIIFVLEPGEVLVSDNFDEKMKIAAIEWKVQEKEK